MLDTRANLTGLSINRTLNVAVGVLLVSTQLASAQTGPSRLQGPAFELGQQTVPDQATLEKERFRRQAAEGAQKQLEQLAEQLRQQLAEEVGLRKSTEARIIELTARLTLTDQLDQERMRLSRDRIEILEERRTALESEVAELKERLRAAVARRQELENSAAQRSAAASTTGRDYTQLTARITELEKKLNAEQWARKLAEAQLKLLSQRETK